MENAGRALLLVAHPDDCIIFGYPFLHNHPEFKWDIIYLTYFDKDDRAREVRSFWRKHNIDTYFLGNRDDYSYVERGELGFNNKEALKSAAVSAIATGSRVGSVYPRNCSLEMVSPFG